MTSYDTLWRQTHTLWHSIAYIYFQIPMPLSQILVPRLFQLIVNALVNSNGRDRITIRTWHTKPSTWRLYRYNCNTDLQLRRPSLPLTSLSCKPRPYILSYCPYALDFPSLLLSPFVLWFLTLAVSVLEIFPHFVRKEFLYGLGCEKRDVNLL